MDRCRWRGESAAPKTVIGDRRDFDPTNRTFTAVNNPMQTARANHTATEVGGGKVIVAGGLEFDPTVSPPLANILDSAELCRETDGWRDGDDKSRALPRIWFD